MKGTLGITLYDEKSTEGYNDHHITMVPHSFWVSSSPTRRSPEGMQIFKPRATFIFYKLEWHNGSGVGS